MSIDYRVISIGTLAAHPLWNEKGDARTGHTTTTLVSTDDAKILVDPSLPAPALLARFSERTNLNPRDVTHVFLTTFQQERRRALGAFEHAMFLIHEPEREAAEADLKNDLARAEDAQDRELMQLIKAELRLLERCETAPDSIAQGVDLYPLPGVTHGACGLLLALPSSTVVIVGDAIPTLEHLNEGKVLPHCVDLQAAQESFKEAIDIADVLVLGRDNIVMNPMRGLM